MSQAYVQMQGVLALGCALLRWTEMRDIILKAAIQLKHYQAFRNNKAHACGHVHAELEMSLSVSLC